MTIPEILEEIRVNLAQELLACRIDTPKFVPANYDVHIASSVMQKAIRRGDELHALAAAATLVESDSNRLWRRLLVIAYEDIGIGDLEIVGWITASHAQKRWRAAHGGEWPVVALLITRMCQAKKDRTADDLLHLAENDPSLNDHRRCWSSAPIDRLLEFIKDPEIDFAEQALAIWLSVGTDRYRSPRLRERRGSPEEVFAAFKSLEVPDDVLAITWIGHKKMSWPLAAFLPAVWLRSQNEDVQIQSDLLPPSACLESVPSYALDTYTRSGKAAIRQLLQTSAPLRSFLGLHAPEQDWPKIVAVMLFRIEGGLMTNRLRWPSGEQIKERADEIIPGLPIEVTTEGLELLRAEIPRLNIARGMIIRQTVG